MIRKFNKIYWQPKPNRVQLKYYSRLKITKTKKYPRHDWRILYTATSLVSVSSVSSDVVKGLFTYYVRQNQGFLEPPSSAMVGIWLTCPPPPLPADVICEQPLRV